MSIVAADYISQQLLDELCDYMAEGHSVRGFFRDVAVETKRNWFHVWLSAHASDEQRTQYARACEDRQDALFEQCFEIADDKRFDTKTRTGRDGEEIEEPNTEWINRSRLRVDTRFKALARMNPKKYGERVNTALSDPDGNALPAAPVQFYLPANGRDDAEKA